LTTPSIPPVPLRKAKAVAKDLDHSGTLTLWRWRKAGWIKSVTIGGTVYIDLNSLTEFMERARDGQYAKPFHGVAAQSQKGGDV